MTDSLLLIPILFLGFHSFVAILHIKATRQQCKSWKWKQNLPLFMSLCLICVSFAVLTSICVRSFVLHSQLTQNGSISPSTCFWALESTALCYFLLFKAILYQTLVASIWQRFMVNDELSQHVGYSKMFLLAWTICSSLWALCHFILYTIYASIPYQQHQIGGKYCWFLVPQLAVSMIVFDCVGYLINMYLFIKPLLMFSRSDALQSVHVLNDDLPHSIRRQFGLALIIVLQSIAARVLLLWFKVPALACMMDVALSSLCVCLMFKSSWSMLNELCRCQCLRTQSQALNNAHPSQIEAANLSAAKRDQADYVNVNHAVQSDSKTSTLHGRVPQLRRDISPAQKSTTSSALRS